jgi:hypothetical protein
MIPANPKVVKMVLRNRSHTLVSVKGHAIDFLKGIETSVPREILQEALSIGAELIGEDPSLATAEKEKPQVPSYKEDQDAAILAAITVLVEKNDPSDFTASNAPKAAAVNRLLTFNAQQKDIISVYVKYKEDLGKKEAQEALERRAEAEAKANEDNKKEGE